MHPPRKGVLVSSDEATIIYLLHLNEQAPAPAKFVMATLDSKNIFVKKEKVGFIRRALDYRLQATIFDDEENSAMQAHSM
jgi:hypothetical protein